ncbi:hypothetical protein KIN20_002349 [Parelaphostrongylus tenuis]|uniref:Uncharacterized protein n=1 Tax=Parelaphostrongylus tenuis TaxID=148309 RepID=A0AAD5LYC5_PARTN|nr:hypothetical protein KIN20_002349 [Parelaphostrongylus tenuis]
MSSSYSAPKHRHASRASLDNYTFDGTLRPRLTSASVMLVEVGLISTPPSHLRNETSGKAVTKTDLNHIVSKDVQELRRVPAMLQSGEVITNSFP